MLKYAVVCWWKICLIPTNVLPSWLRRWQRCWYDVKSVCALCWHWSDLVRSAQLVFVYWGCLVGDMNRLKRSPVGMLEPHAKQVYLIQHAWPHPACANDAHWAWRLPHKVRVCKVQQWSHNKACPLSQLVWTWLKQEIHSPGCQFEWMAYWHRLTTPGT